MRDWWIMPRTTRRRRVAFPLLFVAALICASCTVDDGLSASLTDADAVPVPTEAADGVRAADIVGSLVSDTCPFDVPLDTSPECSRLIVPSAWVDPLSPEVSMQLARFPATDPDGVDRGTVLWLEGGPGGAPLEFLSSWFDIAFADLNRAFDVVVFDPRGVGFSLPNLDCEEVDALYEIDGFLLADQASALRDCSTRLAGNSIDVADYDSLSTARDLEALRRALDVEQWNLVGQSYGSRLAQTYVREFPDAVRAMVLDGAYSTADEPDDDLAAGAKALDRLIASCERDAACAEAHPSFGVDLRQLIDDAADQPIAVSGLNFSDGSSFEYDLDAASLVDVIFQSLYDTYASGSWPDIVADLANGQTWSLDLVVSDSSGGVGSGDDVGAFYSVQCRDEWAYTSDNGEVDPGPFTEVDIASSDAWPFLCAAWGAGAADPVEGVRASGSTPTLVLGGEFDPITPTEGAIEVAAAFDARFVEFERTGHGTIGLLPCAGLTASLFLLDFGVEVGCVDDHLVETTFVGGVDTTSMVEVDLGDVTVVLEMPDWFEADATPGRRRVRDQRLTDLTAISLDHEVAASTEAVVDLLLDLFDAPPTISAHPDGSTRLSGTGRQGLIEGLTGDQEMAIVALDGNDFLVVGLVTAVDELAVDRPMLDRVTASIELGR